MEIKKIICKIIPNHKIAKIRNKYYVVRQGFHRPISEDFFMNKVLFRLGINKGDTLFIHSSMDFLNIDFSPLRLLDILIDTVGKDGNLIFPAWHFNYRAEDYLKDDSTVFDIKRSPAVMGLLPELARRLPGAQRSIHPVSSVVAVGINAEEIVGSHEQSVYPCGELSPYYKMLKYNAKIIGLGVNANFLSFVHCPEDIMGKDFPIQTRTDKLYIGKVRLISGEIVHVETLAAHQNIQKRNIPVFLKKYISGEIYSAYRIHGSDFYVVDANALFDKMIGLAKQNKTIYNT